MQISNFNAVVWKLQSAACDSILLGVRYVILDLIDSSTKIWILKVLFQHREHRIVIRFLWSKNQNGQPSIIYQKRACTFDVKRFKVELESSRATKIRLILTEMCLFVLVSLFSYKVLLILWQMCIKYFSVKGKIVLCHWQNDSLLYLRHLPKKFPKPLKTCVYQMRLWLTQAIERYAYIELMFILFLQPVFSSTNKLYF